MKNSMANKLKQVPVGYLVIGIDVHKKKHAAAVMTVGNQRNGTLLEPNTFV